MRHKKTVGWFLHVSFVLVGLFLMTNFATGRVAYATINPTRGLTVSPLRTELSIAPGTSQDNTLTLSNTNSQPITVHLAAEEFSVIDQNYDYAFNIATQLTKWVTFNPDTLDLAVGQMKTATFRIGVPLGAEPGGRYLSLFATTAAGPADNGVISQQRIASLVYLTIAGDISRSGHLVSLNAPWITIGATKWSTALQNTGTTHYHSRYNVVLEPLVGTNNPIATESGDALILPGTIRLVEDNVPLPALPGIYKVVYTIGLGDSPAKIETRIMVYIPPVAIIILLFAVVLLFSLISDLRLRKKRKRNT
jgi:hypothetical protein